MSKETESGDRFGILCVDDEPGVRRLLTLELTTSGFDVFAVADCACAIKVLSEERVSAVVLDLLLPDCDGIDLLSDIKDRFHLPVVVLTSRSDADVRSEVFQRGADDLFAKPFSPAVVSGTLRTLLAMPSEGVPERVVVNAGKALIDLRQREVRLSGSRVPLSRTEWSLIEYLVEHRGKPRLNEEILSSVWGPAYRNDVAYLRLWMRRLGNKLGDDKAGPKAIHSYLDVGYFLDAR